MFVNMFLMFFDNIFILDIKIALVHSLIVKRNVAFVKRGATIVSETQVCNFKCTVCKRNASFVSQMQHL